MIKRILVTGGCGFIGSHLCEFLLHKGHTITVIDNLSTSSINNLSFAKKRIEVIKCSVEHFDLNQLGSVDGVFHLAAQASVPVSISNFKESSSANMLSTISVINFCSSLGIPLVFASSSAVYGNLHLGDEAGDVDLMNPYAADKYFGEKYCEVAKKINGLNYAALRFFNVYGPRQDPSNPYSGVISIFADRLLKNIDITINGGEQTRDFIFVKDVVRRLWSAFDILEQGDTGFSCNILSGKSCTINELAETMIAITGSSSKKLYQELPYGDPMTSLGAVQRMNKLLGEIETTKLEDGISQTLDWVQAEHD